MQNAYDDIFWIYHSSRGHTLVCAYRWNASDFSEAQTSAVRFLSAPPETKKLIIFTSCSYKEDSRYSKENKIHLSVKSPSLTENLLSLTQCNNLPREISIAVMVIHRPESF